MVEVSNIDYLQRIDEYKRCSFCSKPIPKWMRKDALYCNDSCRVASHRELQKTLLEALKKA